MSDGHKIACAAREWLGTPHVNGAKAKGRGVDCGMLLIAALEDSGTVAKDSIRITPYSNEWHLHRAEEWFLRYVKTYCRQVEEMQEGDFLLYQFGRCVSHGGVYLGGGKIAHAVVGQGVILSDLSDVMFIDAKGASRLRGIYRFGGD
jgi:cell wall-associated NlpC family hydrolase